MTRRSALTIFEDLGDNELSVGGFGTATRRKDVYDLSERDLASPEALGHAAARIQPLQWHLSSLAGTRRDELMAKLSATPPDARRARRRLEALLQDCPIELGDDGEVKAWLLALPKRAFAAVRRATRGWLREAPSFADEEDYFDVPGDGFRCAWEILDGVPQAVLDDLGVELIEGDDRGTDRAYLRSSPATANRRARAAGLPYRFR